MRRGATADARRAAINRATAASGDPSWHCKQSSFLSSASGELVERGASRRRRRMGRGRGVSYGGGQSSLSYLFGGGGGDEPAAAPAKPAAAVEQRAQQPVAAAAAAAPASADGEKQKGIPAGVRGSQTNNYFRAQGQNCGNFLTDRPSTKVHAAPGGGSSLGYLFGGGAPGSK